MVNRQRGIVLTGYVVMALVLVIVIGAGVAWLDHREMKSEVKTANEQAASAREQLGREAESRAGFQNAASSCSASVTQLVVAQNAREAWYQGQLQQSRAQTAKAEQTAREILASHRPAGMTECDAMKKELDDEIARRHPAR